MSPPGALRTKGQTFEPALLQSSPHIDLQAAQRAAPPVVEGIAMLAGHLLLKRPRRLSAGVTMPSTAILGSELDLPRRLGDGLVAHSGCVVSGVITVAGFA